MKTHKHKAAWVEVRRERKQEKNKGGVYQKTPIDL